MAKYYSESEILVPVRPTTQEASEKYNKYLNEHRACVKKAWNWIMTKMPDVLDSETILAVSNLVKAHDASKDSVDEYAQYANYFNVDREKYKMDFDYAWLHHLHNNPHHWQYWFLKNDQDGDIALEIPKPYIFEMICDWWSFSWKSGNLREIFKWYDEHKAYMNINEHSLAYIEGYLNKIKMILDSEEA